jgi:hypothetical protein
MYINRIYDQDTPSLLHRVRRIFKMFHIQWFLRKQNMKKMLQMLLSFLRWFTHHDLWKLKWIAIFSRHTGWNATYKFLIELKFEIEL